MAKRANYFKTNVRIKNYYNRKVKINWIRKSKKETFYLIWILWLDVLVEHWKPSRSWVCIIIRRNIIPNNSTQHNAIEVSYWIMAKMYETCAWQNISPVSFYNLGLEYLIVLIPVSGYRFLSWEYLFKHNEFQLLSKASKDPGNIMFSMKQYPNFVELRHF